MMNGKSITAQATPTGQTLPRTPLHRTPASYRLPAQIYNNIRSIITPDLAANSTVFVVTALIAVWLLDGLADLEIFLKST